MFDIREIEIALVQDNIEAILTQAVPLQRILQNMICEFSEK